MRSMTRTVAAAVLAVASGGAAVADEKPVEIKPSAGADKVEGNCAACHSLDYIPMNSPFLSATAWDAEVRKMINAFGAPIGAADAKTIVDYLKANYAK